MSHFSYNLVEEPWINCTHLDGTPKKMGLREILLKAHELRGIESQNPLTIASTLRVLLALTHRIVDGPRKGRDWRDLYRAKGFSKEIVDSYFQRTIGQFDLFSDEQPFYQTPKLSLIDSSGKSLPVSISILMLERASGNNKTIFDHTTDNTPLSLSPAEAARVLITAQMYSLGGIYKKTTNLFGNFFRWENAVMVEGIYIALKGESLFETIMLNLLVYGSNEPIPSTDADCPVWERKDIGKAVGKRDEAIAPRGYLDYLTCKCRHVLLIPKQHNDRTVVEHVHVAPGELFIPLQNPGFMTKISKKGIPYHPHLDVTRLVWRDSVALFAFDNTTDRRPKAFQQAMVMSREIQLPSRYQCLVVALANEDANPLAWSLENLSIPLELLKNEDAVSALKAGMERAEQIEQALDNAVKSYIRKVLPENSKDVNSKAEATGAKRIFWDRLEGHFRAFLAGIDSSDAALMKWYGDIVTTAWDAMESCVKQRYANSAASFKAWAAAVDELNKRLAGLNALKGGNIQ